MVIGIYYMVGSACGKIVRSVWLLCVPESCYVGLLQLSGHFCTDLHLQKYKQAKDCDK